MLNSRLKTENFITPLIRKGVSVWLGLNGKNLVAHHKNIPKY